MIRGALRAGHLSRLEGSPLEGLADVDFHDPVLDSNGIEVEWAGRARPQHISPDVEDRRVTGTDELTLVRYPRDGTTKMGALSRQGEESTVCESCQIESTLRKGCDGVGLEPFHRAGFDDAAGFFFRDELPRAQKVDGDPDGFRQGHAAQREPGLAEETPSGEGRPRRFRGLKVPIVHLLYKFHGQDNAIPEPRNHTPVMVKTTRTTLNKMNDACRASFLEAPNLLFICIW